MIGINKLLERNIEEGLRLWRIILKMGKNGWIFYKIVLLGLYVLYELLVYIYCGWWSLVEVNEILFLKNFFDWVMSFGNYFISFLSIYIYIVCL